MNDIKRMLSLSGRNPRQEQIDALQSDAKEIAKIYYEAVENIKAGRQLDEGIFSKLVNMIGAFDDHLGDVEKNVAKAAKAFLVKNGQAIKKKYETREAKTELNNLMKSVTKIIDAFAKLEEVSPNILRTDVGLKGAVAACRDVMAHFVTGIQNRLVALQQESMTVAEINDFLIEELGQEGTLSEAKPAEPGAVQEVMGTPEYKAICKVMKDISSNAMRKHGTFCFDTGLYMFSSRYDPKTKTVEASLDKNTKYVMSIYSTGWIRGEVVGKSSSGNDDTYRRKVKPYRLGKQLSSDDPVAMYRKAFVDMVQRFEKKKARYKSDELGLTKAYQELQDKLRQANFGSDASEDDAERGD